MFVWVAVGFSIALVALLLALPVRIRINLQGRGDPDGAWALAGGVQTGPVAWSAVAAHGVAFRSQLHVFGKELRLGRSGAKSKKTEPKEETESSESALDSAKSGYLRVARWFDPFELLLFLVRERRRVEFGTVEVTLDYSFEDVALTGKIQGAVYVLGAIFQDKVRIMQVVSWESVDRAAGALSGEVTLWPGKALLDTALFAVRHVRLRGTPEAKQLQGKPQ